LILVKSIAPAKALVPIDVTDVGKDIEVILGLFKKALVATLVAPAKSDSSKDPSQPVIFLL
jgi:hypothetical protein